MFQEIQLTNFKSFAGNAGPIPLAPVTILVGANASGKSNLFDAFRFLKGSAQGLSVPESLAGKWEGGARVHAGIRGGVEEACWGSEAAFSLRVVAEFALDDPALRPGLVRPARFEHSMSCALHPAPSFASESLRVSGGTAGTEITMSRSEYPHLNGSEGLLATAIPGMRDEDHRRGLLWNFLEFLRGFRFLQVRQEQMRQYVPRSMPELGEQGENLSAVLYRICQDSQKKEQYVDWLGSLCVPEV
jgi:predicted ATPase